MPLPTQATVYDDKGIPISVDPRIPPGWNRAKLESLAKSRVIRPEQKANEPNHNTTKRIATDAPQDDLIKRVKSEHTPRPFILESPAIIAAPPPTPVSASPVVPTRGIARESMAECAANGITITSADLSARHPTSSTGPPWPLEAIETIHQVAKDLLLALVRKGAHDREKQFQVAVGTLRTCLDVDFMPYMDGWKADADARARATTSQPTPLPSAILDSSKPLISITIPKESVVAPISPQKPDSAVPIAFGIPPSRETLRGQLAHARTKLDQQAQELKHKDDEIARSKEENKRLTARLTQLSAQAAPAKPVKATSGPEMAALQRLNKEHIDKLNHQRIQLTNLLAQNAQLKDKLKSAGMPLETIKGEGRPGESMDPGKQQQKERKEPTWVETWQIKGRRRTSRMESSRHGDSGGSDTSSILAAPMSEKDARVASEMSRRSGSYSNFNIIDQKKAKPNQTDSRSHWARSAAERQIGPPSPLRPYVPTGPRHPHIQAEPGEIVRAPQYTSTDGWGDYYSKDGFGMMQADRNWG